MGGVAYLVFAVVGPDVVKTRGREERRRMSEEFTAAADGEKHLQSKYTNRQLLKDGFNCHISRK